jgi:thiol-disulfide isomerase/thioredoxin
MRSKSQGTLVRLVRTLAASRLGSATLVCLLMAGLAAYLTAGGEAKAKVGKMPKESVAQQPIDTLGGPSYTLAGLRGKVVVLDFFGDWCAHSRDHSRALARFTEDDFGRGLQIIGQAVEDDRTNAASVQKFVADQRINYPVGLTNDRKFAGYVESRDLSVPQTLVYGRDGKLVAHFNGHSTQIEAELAEVVKRELAKQ